MYRINFDETANKCQNLGETLMNLFSIIIFNSVKSISELTSELIDAYNEWNNGSLLYKICMFMRKELLTYFQLARKPFVLEGLHEG